MNESSKSIESKESKESKKEDILSRIANRLENIVSDADAKTDINKLKKQLKTIVLKIYNYIEDSKGLFPSEKQSTKNFSPLSISPQIKLNIINSTITLINHKTEIYLYGKYEGDFKNGKKDGKGTMTYKNEYIYEGNWKDGKRDGKGIYLNKTNKDKYEGDFKLDKAEGKGVADYDNGDKYEGDYKDWNKDGKGIYYYNNGDKYEGDFKNDKSEGIGAY